MTAPTAGRGSNQYQRRGVGRFFGSRKGAAAVSQAVSSDDDVDEIGWAFHPDAPAWDRCGFGSVRLARPWLDAGFTAEDAKSWSAMGFDPTEASEWRDGQFTPESAHAYAHVAKVSVADAHKWLTESGCPDNHVASWVEAGFSPAEALAWARNMGIGFHDAATAARWRDNGFDTRRDGQPPAGHCALHWIKADSHALHRFAPEEAAAWRARDFSPRDAVAWSAIGCDPVEAFNWRDHGFLPREAQDRRAAGLAPGQPWNP